MLNISRVAPVLKLAQLSSKLPEEARRLVTGVKEPK